MVAFSTSPLLGVDLTKTWTPPGTSTTLTPYQSGDQPPVSLGLEITASDTTGGSGAQYQYCIATGGAIAQYDFVGIDENFVAQPLTKTMAEAGWRIGAAQVAFASGDYGFIAIKGDNIRGNVLGSALPDVPLFVQLSTNAGKLDDAAPSSTYLQVLGIKAVASAGTATTAVEIIMTWPLYISPGATFAA